MLTSFLLGAAVLTSSSFAKEESWGPWAPPFKTHPAFTTFMFNISIEPEFESQLAPGYIFLAPYAPGNDYFGPQIYDVDGTLIWNGKDAARDRAMDPQVCDYNGTIGQHLCWSESRKADHVVGARIVTSNRIFDNTYTPVGRDYAQAPLGLQRFPNEHEFNMLPGGETFIQAIYNAREMDLSMYGGSEVGWVLDGCFQEINITTGEPEFSWCGTDYMEPWHTYIYMNIPINTEEHVNITSKIAGQGTANNPWDYMHINSIDKNEEGDYIVSERHLNQLSKVAGKNNVHGVEPGTILWRIGGKNTDIDMGDVAFSRQHHVRFLKTTHEETTISILNNAWEGINDPTDPASNGQIFIVNNKTMTARMVQKYLNPEPYPMSASQGSMQVLPNGNAFTGWGNIPKITEYTPDGTPIYHVRFTEGDENNYRAFKFEWIGNPQQPPKLVPYSRTCSFSKNSPLIAYVSWNGATEVSRWRFFTSNSQDGPWILAGTYDKEGFETQVDLTGSTLFGSFQKYISVEAIGKNNSVLGSTISKTWVPKKDLKCDKFSCTEPEAFAYSEALNVADQCELPTETPALTLLFVLVLMLELAAWGFHFGWKKVMASREQRLPGFEKWRSRPTPKRFVSGKEPIESLGSPKTLRATGVGYRDEESSGPSVA